MNYDLQKIITYYKDLIILQYRDKPKAQSTVQSIVELLMADGLIFDVRNAYNFDTAIGRQLDVIGQYIGINRLISSGELDDDDYRILLKLKAIQNNSNHSLYIINKKLTEVFQDQIKATTDYLMHMFYFIKNNNNLINALIEKQVLPRPMGVGIIIIQEPINPKNKYFGFSRYNTNPKTKEPDVGGFKRYNNPNINKDIYLLTYKNIISYNK